MQGTGAQRQQKIYSEAKFISGVTVRVPANVDANAAKAAPVNEPEPEQEQAKPAVSDFDPSEKPSEEQSEVTETEPSKEPSEQLSEASLIAAKNRAESFLRVCEGGARLLVDSRLKLSKEEV